MKKVLIGLLALGSISAQASCYWGYANHNLDRKIQNGILTLGANVLVSKVAPSGIEKSLELLTESIGVKNENTDFYLKNLKEGRFGKNLERILVEGKTDRLERMVNSLNKNGVEVTIQEVAEAVLALDKSNSLCNESRVMSSYGSFTKLKTLNQIEKILSKNLK